MKQTLKSITAVVVGLAMGICACAQTAYKGQLYVNDERFSLQGELLHVQLRFSYDGNILNSGETLNLTPVLKNGTQMKTLSSVIVNGSERGKYEKRSDAISHRVRSNVAVVTSDKRKGSRYFVYDTTIPYSDWMNGSSLYVESEEHGWGKKPHVYEDQIFSSIRVAGVNAHANSAMTKESSAGTHTAKPEWIQILDPSQSAVSRTTISGEISLTDNKNIGKLSGTKFDRAVMEALKAELENYLGTSGTEVANLQLVGYGAPIGNYRSNERNAAAKAVRLKQYLMNNRQIGSEGLIVTWVAEDWDSIASIVESSQMQLKSAVLDVIHSIPVVSGREDQIKSLGGGSAYSYLSRYVFPEVPRIKYTAMLKTSVGDGADTYNNDSRTLSLSHMYATAQNFQKGSREFSDVVDLMARLFPGNVEACVDAAGAALMRGDLSAADNYLSAWQTDPRAYCNLGVLYLLREDYDKAEVYLGMAKANGVREASRALAQLEKERD